MKKNPLKKKEMKIEKKPRDDLKDCTRIIFLNARGPTPSSVFTASTTIKSLPSLRGHFAPTLPDDSLAGFPTPNGYRWDIPETHILTIKNYSHFLLLHLFLNNKKNASTFFSCNYQHNFYISFSLSLSLSLSQCLFPSFSLLFFSILQKVTLALSHNFY